MAKIKAKALCSKEHEPNESLVWLSETFLELTVTLLQVLSVSTLPIIMTLKMCVACVSKAQL